MFRSKFFRWIKLNFSLRWILILFLILLVSSALLFIKPASLVGSSSKSIFIVGLVNLNLVLLVALCFVVGRNLLKLFFDRKNRVVGSKLRKRLVLAFITVALIPTLIMFVFASGLINQAISGWFNPQVESIFDNALVISDKLLEQEKTAIRSQSRQVKNFFENSNQDYLSSENSQQAQQSFMRSVNQIRNRYELNSIRIYDQKGKLIINSQSVVNEIPDLAEPVITPDTLVDYFADSAAAAAAQQTNIDLLKIERNSETQFLRNYLELNYQAELYYLLVTRRLDPELSQSLNALQTGHSTYGQLRYFKTPLAASYLLTLALVGGTIFFAAIWFAFYLGREISLPIQKLSAATKSVAKGIYPAAITVRGNDELAELTASFNRMLEDLKSSEQEIIRRRNYTEAIVGNLATGVIGLNENFEIIKINQAAVDLLQIELSGELDDRSFLEITQTSNLPEVQQFLLSNQTADESGTKVQQETDISSLNRRMILTLKTVAVQGGTGGSAKNYLLIVEDITNLLQVQKISAWRDIARQLAHEIKNPLTPIKLSAQRIARQLGKLSEADLAAASQTIVEHVDTIKVLIDEFSQYARLPRTNLLKVDLSQLLSSITESYQQKNLSLFYYSPAQSVADQPKVLIDEVRFRQAMVNLIENAIYAVREGDRPEVTVRLTLDHEKYTVTVSDNGAGITPEDRPGIFDPYFTTKASGTGLGLTVVAAVVAEHQGQIKIFDLQPHGTKFQIELPLSQLSDSSKATIGRA